MCFVHSHSCSHRSVKIHCHFLTLKISLSSICSFQFSFSTIISFTYHSLLALAYTSNFSYFSYSLLIISFPSILFYNCLLSFSSTIAFYHSLLQLHSTILFYNCVLLQFSSTVLLYHYHLSFISTILFYQTLLKFSFTILFYHSFFYHFLLPLSCTIFVSCGEVRLDRSGVHSFHCDT